MGSGNQGTPILVQISSPEDPNISSDNGIWELGDPNISLDNGIWALRDPNISLDNGIWELGGPQDWSG